MPTHLHIHVLQTPRYLHTFVHMKQSNACINTCKHHVYKQHRTQEGAKAVQHISCCFWVWDLSSLLCAAKLKLAPLILFGHLAFCMVFAGFEIVKPSSPLHFACYSQHCRTAVAPWILHGIGIILGPQKQPTFCMELAAFWNQYSILERAPCILYGICSTLKLQ